MVKEGYSDNPTDRRRSWPYAKLAALVRMQSDVFPVIRARVLNGKATHFYQLNIL
jgi:hypothetical protein